MELEELCELSGRRIMRDRNGHAHAVTLTMDELVWEDGLVEHLNEDFMLDGEFVDYIEVAKVFGTEKLEAFILEILRSEDIDVRRRA